MMLLFIWGRLRYDMVAVIEAARGAGVRHRLPKQAFYRIFSDDIVIIVASAVGAPAAVQRSGASSARCWCSSGGYDADPLAIAALCLVTLPLSPR